MAKHPKNQRSAELIFNAAVVCAVVVCAFVMVKFRSPAPSRTLAGPAKSLRDQVIALPPIAATLLPPSLEPIVPLTAKSAAKESVAPKTALAPARKSPPIKVVRKAPHHKKVVKVAARPVKGNPAKAATDDLSFLEGVLEVGETTQDALNVQAPLDLIAENGLSENNLLDDAAEALALPAQIDPALRVEQDIPREPRVTEVVALYQKEDYSRIRSRLGRLEETSATLDEFLATPEPKDPGPAKLTPELVKKTSKREPASAFASLAASPETTAAAPVSLRGESAKLAGARLSRGTVSLVSMAGVSTTVTASAATSVASSVVSSAIASAPSRALSALAPVPSSVSTHYEVDGEESETPTQSSVTTPAATIPRMEDLPTSTQEVLAEGSAPGEPSLNLPTRAGALFSPITAGVGGAVSSQLFTLAPRATVALPSVQPVSPPKSPERPIVVASGQQAVSRMEMTSGAPTLVVPPKLHAATPGITVAGNSSVTVGDIVENPDSGVMYGRIEPDTRLAGWLESVRGHIELYLHPVQSRDPQDTIFLDYQYPSEEFQVELEGLRGPYRLVAGIYTPKASLPVAQIAYPKPITAASYKENVAFVLTRDMIERASIGAVSGHADDQVFNATLFEGASGNHRAPKPIPNGTLRIIGFPEWGTLVSDKDGNVRIPKVPGQSELLIEVTAAGFYPTYKTIPTFDTSVYVPIYLLSRDKVEAITRYFTKNPQKAGRSVVMGRVFDPSTRTPKKDAVVNMSFRKGRALYFGALPDPSLPATSETGLFGFFNVTPSFRSLGRPDRAAFLLDVRPDSGEYVELGRGGKKSLSAGFLDPFTNARPAARIKIVGDSRSAFYTDKDGQVRIPDLDLPSGVVTLEVEAEGYPLTWYTLPWNTRERDITRSLFLLQKDLIRESSARIARLKMDRARGSLVGGAVPSFFRRGSSCVTVSLLDGSGNPVGKAAGPFPLLGKGAFDQSKPLCLSQRSPGFAYFNLPSGQYILKWTDAKGQVFRSHVVYVGVNRVSIAVD